MNVQGTDGENEHRPMCANISCHQNEENGPTRQEAASFTFERWLTSTDVVNGSVVAAGWCPPMLEHTNGFSSDGTSVVVGSPYLLLMSVRFPNKLDLAHGVCRRAATESRVRLARRCHRRDILSPPSSCWVVSAARERSQGKRVPLRSGPCPSFQHRAQCSLFRPAPFDRAWKLQIREHDVEKLQSICGAGRESGRC